MDLAGETDERGTAKRNKASKAARGKRKCMLLKISCALVLPMDFECVINALGPTGKSKTWLDPSSGSIPEPPPLL